jgi:hypothetical protein
MLTQGAGMRRRILTLACAVGKVAILGYLFLLTFCSSWTTTYCAGTDPAASWSMAKDTFFTRSWFPLGVPDYQIRDGKLYLKVQMFGGGWLMTFVTFGDWDAEKVRRFRQKHPELEPLWPDGGVRWLGQAGPWR